MAAPGTSDRPAGPAAWPEHIRARYGVTDRPRWVPWALGALLLVGLAAVTAVGLRVTQPPVDSGILAHDTLSDESLWIRFEVQRPEAVAATCVLRARADDGFDVGYATVELPVASGRTTHEYTLRTAHRAILGEVLGCGVGAAPTGIPPAQFRPGVVPPEQPWSP